MGDNGSKRELEKGGLGFYTVAWSRFRVEFVGRHWAAWAVFWGGTMD
jgi:hypothetical protein